MKYIDVANIACGFHAGDPSLMVKTVGLAKQHGVKAGAHPGLQGTDLNANLSLLLTLMNQT
jgi:UPF0271 protein